MDLIQLPDKVRQVYRDAGLITDEEIDDRLKIAMIGLQNAIEIALQESTTAQTSTSTISHCKRRRSQGAQTF